MKSIVYLMISVLLVGCATSPPRNKANACLLLNEKDEWEGPLRRASARWNIPEYTILAIMYHESKFVSNAEPPPNKVLGINWGRISTAYGYAQALDGTWEEYQRLTGNWGASRSSFADSADFIGWYLNRFVRQLKISPRNAYELYLVYHQGPGGFRKKSYLSKPSIMSYARKVQSTAVEYKEQMNSCRDQVARNDRPMTIEEILRSEY